jgi:2-phosphosulfolactate phosphatase
VSVVFDHIQLSMPAGREIEARAFYLDLLGLSEEPKPAPLVASGECWFMGQGCLLHVGVDPDFRPQRKAHVAFTVGDVRGLAARVGAAGFPVHWDDAVPDVARFYTADPFGNRLEFMQHGTGLIPGRQGMSFSDQGTAACRCEWGVTGHDSLGAADVVIVVDVFSFSTCVDVAVGRGASILPHSWQDESAAKYAASQDAQLAGARGSAQYSLSPQSFLAAPPGLRCVLPSPNGATISLRAAATGASVLSGCLRNATAIARAATRLGTSFNVIASGERWPDGSMRFAVEDWLGAGAILSHLPGRASPEASSAIAAFERNQDRMLDALMASSSGRELIGRGFGVDIELAAQLDVSDHVPELRDRAFIRKAD